ncbi:MAG: metallophosphoesterase [Candidatus Brocadiae bacterium]|nr:metallophosphoesterase [Candidatus Brocadiia bacterium]
MSLRLAWATDIHINHLPRDRAEALFRTLLDDLRAAGPDGVLLGGDIAEGPTLEYVLGVLEEQLDRPVWFVMGNHDAYWSSLAAVRALARQLTRTSRHLRWLPDAGVIPLTGNTALVGHDGWGDGRYGNGVRSAVSGQLADHIRVSELTGLTGEALFSRLAALGDEAARHLRGALDEAVREFRRVLVLTHVPPFAEAACYNGNPPDDDWTPHFACRATGDLLREVAEAHPDNQFIVLAGHTHTEYDARILPNLRVRVGRAKYGAPEVQGTLEID